MGLKIFLLIMLLMAIVWTVMTPRLLRSVVGLAAVSVILSMIMFYMDSPLAAVFELSVCAGLIPVIFFTTISFTQRVGQEELIERKKIIFRQYVYLPIILAVVAVVMLLSKPVVDFVFPTAPVVQDVRKVLWDDRHLDLLGQIIIILAGALGIVALFKETKK
ncbi:MAG TPA: hypothetical protein PKY78_07800 [Candidatus Omnitrophota bacterium]|nr:hypothetical protein [Candidatus Omnitrophota bacterium]HPS20871.1 hypothetical protein [Candidatus Omnitrophota bacterium]